MGSERSGMGEHSSAGRASAAAAPMPRREQLAELIVDHRFQLAGLLDPGGGSVFSIGFLAQEPRVP